MQRSLDILAVSISGLCVVHCVMTPVALIMFLVLSGTLFAQEEFHLFLLWVILPTSGIALFLGCRRHKDRRVLLLASIGLSLLLLAAFFEHGWVGERAGRVLTFLGGAIMAAGHVLNYRQCQNDRCHM